MLNELVFIRAVKLAEKLHLNFLPKYYTSSNYISNLKGINSVRKKKKLWDSLLRPQEDESS